jgi:hypothetical protein
MHNSGFLGLSSYVSVVIINKNCFARYSSCRAAPGTDIVESTAGVGDPWSRFGLFMTTHFNTFYFDLSWLVWMDRDDAVWLTGRLRRFPAIVLRLLSSQARLCHCHCLHALFLPFASHFFSFYFPIFSFLLSNFSFLLPYFFLLLPNFFPFTSKIFPFYFPVYSFLLPNFSFLLPNFFLFTSQFFPFYFPIFSL